jgi:hypothetical protein
LGTPTRSGSEGALDIGCGIGDTVRVHHRRLAIGRVAAMCVGLTSCSGPVDLTVVNPCSVDVRVQTYDGELDSDGNWQPDPTPIADFIVPAKGSKKQKDALQFTAYPEEIRLVSPVERSFLISIVDDLDDDDRWKIPLEVCDDANPTAAG